MEATMKLTLSKARTAASLFCLLAFVAFVAAPFVHQLEIFGGAICITCNVKMPCSPLSPLRSAKIPGDSHHQHDASTCKICQAFLNSKYFTAFTPVTTAVVSQCTDELRLLPICSHHASVAELTGTSPRAPPFFC